MAEETFGEFIRRKRIEKQLGLRDAARRLGIAASYLADIEKGRRYAPKLETIERMSQMLDVPIDKLNHLAEKSHPDGIPPDFKQIYKGMNGAGALLRRLKRDNISPQKILDDLKDDKDE